ncbi:MAG: nucleotidyltransferase domain-containing protein [Desulfobacteraceae bacterium]|nr:nucleotidyltransferase domain-containing protein [Desulfobacteraceae bacterium]
MLSEELKGQLLRRLLTLSPRKIILFGSHAYGQPGKDSDIDLLVVTSDDFLPDNFAEKNAIYLRVANVILDLEKQYPIDLIVHTKSMHEKFINLDSMFARNITATGEVLYEAPDPAPRHRVH